MFGKSTLLFLSISFNTLLITSWILVTETVRPTVAEFDESKMTELVRKQYSLLIAFHTIETLKKSTHLNACPFESCKDSKPGINALLSADKRRSVIALCGNGKMQRTDFCQFQ